MRTLSFAEIRAFTRGVIACEDVGDAVCFHRVPASLRPFYTENPFWKVRMACPAGVRLRLASDTCGIRLGLRFGEMARQVFTGVVLADTGTEIPFGPESPCPAWEGEIYRNETGGMQVIEIWFPHLCVAELAWIAIDEACRLESAPPYAFTWLALGDSITQGMTALLPTRTYVARCATALNADVINLGIGGAKLDAALADASDYPPADLVTIAYGANDFAQGVSPDLFGVNARRLLETLTTCQPQARIGVLSPIPSPHLTTPNPLGLPLEAYHAALINAAESLPDVQVFNGAELLSSDEALYADGVHPNADGMAIYAENLCVKLTAAAQCAAR